MTPETDMSLRLDKLAIDSEPGSSWRLGVSAISSFTALKIPTVTPRKDGKSSS